MKTKVTFIGAGYVGIVNALGFARRAVQLNGVGNTEIWLVDNDEHKINMLKTGSPPIYEEQIQDYLDDHDVYNVMHYTTNLKEALDHTDYVFICVGTPQTEDGSADLTAVRAVAKAIGENVDHSMTVVMKSTVPVGTTEEIEILIDDTIAKRGMEYADQLEKEHGNAWLKKHPEVWDNSPIKIDIGVADNPEFLKEGHAFNDFSFPDRIIIGVHPADTDVKEKMEDLYILGLGFSKKDIFVCNIPSAESIKYASNSMLAMRISFANMMAAYCEQTGADIDDVMTGVGMDRRIGSSFLKAGIGYGGSCFPKDVAALIHQMEEVGVGCGMLKETSWTNECAKARPWSILHKTIGNLSNMSITVWGAAFKEGTDDIRESPIIKLFHMINSMEKDVIIKVYDPLAKNNLRKYIQENTERFTNITVKVVDNILESVENTNAIVFLTPTRRYNLLNFRGIREKMNPTIHPVFIDCRNYYSPKEIVDIVDAGFRYESIGRDLYWLRQ